MAFEYTCGAENETIPGYCGRGVPGPGVLCCCHGPGSCRHRGAVSGGPAAPPPPPPPLVPPQVPSPRRPKIGDLPTDEQLRIMADVAQKTLTDGWKDAVAEQLAKVLNDDFWKSVPRRRRWTHPDCQLLADLANFMERTRKGVHDAVGAMAREGLGWFGRPTIERRIAEEFAKRIPLPGEKHVIAVIHTLRIYGIWVCLPNGINYVIVRCPCFIPLAKDKTEEELKRVLNEKLNVLVRKYGPPWLP